MPVTEFYAKGRQSGELLSYCKSCHGARAAAWRAANRDRSNELWRDRAAKNRDKMAEYDLRRRVKEKGLDLELIMGHFRAHNGRCDICGELPATRAKSARRLSIDHDHVTGEFRGLICRPCNLALGNMLDNPEWLMKAASYLQMHPAASSAADEAQERAS